MRKLYSALIGLALLLASSAGVRAQSTTITTGIYSSLTSLTGSSVVTFSINNTNSYPIDLSSVDLYMVPASTGANLILWYSGTSLGGLPTISTAGGFTQITTSGPITVTTTAIQPNVFPSLGTAPFTIPANTEYRFAIQSDDGLNYGAAAATPTSFSGGGANLKVGSATDTTGTGNVGYSGTPPGPTITPRSFAGSVTFSPSVACTSPPTAGTTTVSPNDTVCTGTVVTIGLTGGTGGTGQTYQLQSALSTAGPFTDVGTAGGSPAFSQTVTATAAYRIVVTCGGASDTSTPVLVTVPAAFPGGTYTINSAVTTGGINFQTINAAVAAISCGIAGPVVFDVVPFSGPYNEQVSIPPIGGASPTNTVTFNGNGAILSYTSINTNARYGFLLNGADFITIDSFNIRPLGSTTTNYGFGIQLINGADRNVISSNTITIDSTATSAQYAGIVVSGSLTSATTAGSNSDSNLITGNTLNGGYAGITVLGAAGTPATGNVVVGNTLRNVYFYSTYFGTLANGVIDSNYISRPTRLTNTTFYGIFLTGASTNTAISRNRISNPFGATPISTSAAYPIWLSSAPGTASQPNNVFNNLIFNMTGRGIIYGIQVAASDYAQLYHNTISLDDTAAATGATRGIFQSTTTATALDVRNNIITITRGGTAIKHAVYYAATSSTAVTSNNNNLYVASPGGGNNVAFNNTTTYTTLSAYQTATSKDLQSASLDPVYASVTAGNFTPTAASLNDIGTPVGVLTDINGAPRSTTTATDPGAYEFTPAACTAPPTAGTTVATPASGACAGSTISVSLTGNSIGLGQSYQLESGPSATGPFTAVGSASGTFSFSPVVTDTTFFRVAVTCSGNTQYSTPVEVTIKPQLNGLYTINSAAAAGGDNFQTITEAVQALSCGITGPVIFDVTPFSGPYTEQVTIPAISGVSASNTVTFNGNGAVLTYASTTSTTRAGFYLDGADFVTIDGFDIRPTGTYGWGIQMTNSADNNTISNNTINLPDSNGASSTFFAGIVISGSATSATTAGSNCDNNTITGNSVNGGYYGITLLGSSTAAATGNVVSNNTFRNFSFYGMYLSYLANNSVEANVLTRPTRSTVTSFYGIYLVNPSTNNIVTRNRIFNSFGGATGGTEVNYPIFSSGFDATVGNENVVSNNLIYDMNNQGLIYALYNSSTDHIKYYHNTVSLDNTASTATAATRGFYQLTAATGIDLKNNIFSITRGGTGIKYALYFGTPATTFTSDYNNFYLASAGGADSIAFVGGVGYNELPAYQAATTQDAASDTLNPGYAAPATGDFTPTVGPLDNSGTPVGVTVDINGATRSTSTPDVGAVEFLVPLCSTPPTAGMTIISDTLVCSGSTVTIGLVGNSTGIGQTYQLEESATAGGTFSAVGSSAGTTSFSATVGSSTYYRVAVTCSGITTYSTEVLVTVKTPMGGGTYSINPAVPAGPSNFQTIVAAMDAMECGIAGAVVLDMAPGTYNEQMIFPTNLGGTSATNTVTVNGNGAVLAFTPASSTQRAGVKINGADYITINNLVIVPNTTTATFGFGIQLFNDADNITVRGCTVNIDTSETALAFTGIAVSGSETSATIAGSNCDNVTIDSNTVIGGYYSITNMGNTTTLNTGNSITRNTVRDFYLYGVHTGGNTGMLVQDNDISRPMRSTVSTLYGIYISSGHTASTWSRNRIHDVTGGVATSTATLYPFYILAGADGAAGAENVFSNNAIYNIFSGGLLYAIYNFGADFGKYYHNTISLDDAGATTTSATRGFFLSAVATGLEFKNNIVSIRRGGSGVKHAMFLTTSGTGIASDYNDYFVTTPGTGGGVASVFGTNYTTLAALQAGTTYDDSSVSIDPNYVTTPGPTFLAPQSFFLDNQGTPLVGFTTDLYQNLRSTTTPDMGAVEYTSPLSPLAVGLGAISATNAGARNRVDWNTVTEAEGDRYTVERSADGKTFNTISPEEAARGRASAYTFWDAAPLVGVSYYRVRFLHTGGGYSLSPVVSATMNGGQASGLAVFPNPATGTVTFVVPAVTGGEAVVTDVAGRTVLSVEVAGRSTTIDLSPLRAGTYWISYSVEGRREGVPVTKL